MAIAPSESHRVPRRRARVVESIFCKATDDHLHVGVDGAIGPQRERYKVVDPFGLWGQMELAENTYVA